MWRMNRRIMGRKKSVIICQLLLTIALISCSKAGLDPIDDVPKTEEELFEEQGKIWLESLCSKVFQGRRFGTDGDRLAFEYLRQELENMGYEPECQPFETESGVIGRNIIVSIPGHSDSTVIVGGHYDGAVQSTGGNHFQAANDNGSGTVAMLLFLKSLKDRPIDTDRSIKCCFWDGEEVFEGRAFNGSKHFVSSVPKSSLGFILYYENLDTVGHDHENNIYIEYGGKDRIRVMLENLSLSSRFAYHVSACSVYNSDYAPFHLAGIPFINYHDHNSACDNPNHSIKDVKEAISVSRLVKIVSDVRESIESY